MKTQSGRIENAPDGGDDQDLDTRFEDADGRNRAMFGSVLMRLPWQLHWREACRGFTCFRDLGLTHGDERYKQRCANAQHR
jgi:hypothetical protein